MFATEVDRDEQLYWLALQLVPGLGSRKTGQLIQHFDSPRGVFRSSLSELEGLGIPGSSAQSILSGCTFDDAATQQQKMLDAGVTLLSLNDPRYPRHLRTTYDPPPLLFARGRLELLDTVMLGIVGTRRPTPYGQAACTRLATDLALAGLTIVSGLARGIDTAAHRATLDAAGSTIAVLGCGVDVVYPAENRKLAEQVAREGLLLSEFSMGTPGYPQNFPIRNRIISGLSFGILVVEGAKYSGSAITARLALEQSRELFAVPGNITNKMSWGPNLLIKQGAKLVQEAEDVLSELGASDRRRMHERRANTPAPEQQSLLDDMNSGAALTVMDHLSVDQPKHMDELMDELPQLSSSEVIAALFELEMLRKARQLPGLTYVRVL
ncbi:MAG: DNA-protecting protein DprA [Acidobacteria bacterium]|nr:DNA-protecting protein DprA [Acidobacteriota bacterium]